MMELIANVLGIVAGWFKWRSSGVRALNCGGNVSHDLPAGVFASILATAPSDAYWFYGASPSYHTF